MLTFLFIKFSHIKLNHELIGWRYNKLENSMCIKLFQWSFVDGILLWIMFGTDQSSRSMCAMWPGVRSMVPLLPLYLSCTQLSSFSTYQTSRQVFSNNVHCNLIKWQFSLNYNRFLSYQCFIEIFHFLVQWTDLQMIQLIIVVFRCCPECKTHTFVSEGSDLTVSNGSHCFFRRWRYHVHDTFRIDPCTRCSCQPGGIVCRRFHFIRISLN